MGAENLGVHHCPDCSREFGKAVGLSVHRCKAHPEVYHLENVSKQKMKAHCEREEMVLLTREKLRAEAEGVKEMNSHLQLLFPSRTYDSIKSQWRARNTRYRQILSTLRAEHQVLNGSGPEQATPGIAEGTEATSRMHNGASSLPFSQQDHTTEFFGTRRPRTVRVNGVGN